MVGNPLPSVSSLRPPQVDQAPCDSSPVSSPSSQFLLLFTPLLFSSLILVQVPQEKPFCLHLCNSDGSDCDGSDMLMLNKHNPLKIVPESSSEAFHLPLLSFHLLPCSIQTLQMNKRFICLCLVLFWFSFNHMCLSNAV